MAQEQILKDKDIYPSDEVIFSIISNKRIVWETIMGYAHENYPVTIGEWKYYNDGKQWLFRLLLKKKTIFWISLVEDTFRITFYFGGKAESLIIESTLSENVKKEFLTREFSGPFRPVTIKIKDISDFDDVRKLIDLKIRQK
jgi:hypothetical protein